MTGRIPQRRKSAPVETGAHGPTEGMTRKDLLTKNALVWSSVALMLGAAVYVAAKLAGR